MATKDLSAWAHDHRFGQEQVRSGEKRTLIVVVITAVMMVVEIAAGVVYGSMALLADGLHMASHAASLAIAFFAYVIARRLAADARFSFGTGKLSSLAGFASAVLLLGFALVMVTESAARLLNPVRISYDQALFVAVVGLFVNGICAWILASTPNHHGHHHEHHAQHDDHDHGPSEHHHHEEHHRHQERHHDHNLRAAYLHVLADSLTSVFAIVALLAAKYYGVDWLDPVMGFVGAALVTIWSVGLIRDSAGVLLDRQAGAERLLAIRAKLEAENAVHVTDLHCWSIGQGIYAAAIVIVCESPQPPDAYRALLPPELGIAHATIEVHAYNAS